MKTYLDCIPCFYKQALMAARMSGASEEVQREVLNNLSKVALSFTLTTTPAEMGREIYAMISKITGKKDPYREIKEKSNKLALNLLPYLYEKIINSDDRLLTALRLAIIGNIIDFGVKTNEEDIYNKMNSLIEENIDSQISQLINDNEHFIYNAFKEYLLDVETILYLADNAGEVVFDRILIEVLVNYYHKNVIYAVKGKPVLNGALVDDAIICGINSYANVISTGTDSPGIILKYCSPEFIRIFNNAEMIISKGQGNFEALSEEDNPLFFLLIAKCPVIARHLKCNIGDFILENNFKKKNISITKSTETDNIES